MRTVIIGGTGHVGTYLVPRLVAAGHEVIVVSRGNRGPYLDHPAWRAVQRVQIDREAAESDGTLGEKIRSLRPDIVIDMLSFRPAGAEQLVEALLGQIQQLLCCGTIWINGYSVQVPTAEDQVRNPVGDYGVQKHLCEQYLLEQAHRRGFPVTVLHPGHIVGRGWVPVAPTGCADITAFTKLAHGEEVVLPNLGMETVHHVHADDVAQAFMKAMTHWGSAVGESFYVVSPAALTLRGYAEAVAEWFGQTANLRFLPIDDWKRTLPPTLADDAMEHVRHSSNLTCQKARRLLGYEPRYSSLEAVREAVLQLIELGQLDM